MINRRRTKLQQRWRIVKRIHSGGILGCISNSSSNNNHKVMGKLHPLSFAEIQTMVEAMEREVAGSTNKVVHRQ